MAPGMEPLTDAGRALVAKWRGGQPYMLDSILAVEAEVRANERKHQDEQMRGAYNEGRASVLKDRLDKNALAEAIRLVEMTRAMSEGYLWEGPPAKWFDGYAEDIATQYEQLVTK